MRSGTLIALSSIMGVNGLKSHFPNLSTVSVKFSTKVLHIMQLSNLGFVKVDVVQAVTLLSAQVNFNPCSSRLCFDWGEIRRRKSVQNVPERLRGQ